MVTGDVDQMAVHAAYALDPGDDLLTDVAPLVEIHMGAVETHFGGESVLIQFVAPFGDPV